MRVLFIFLGMIVGAAIALILDKTLGNKIENKNQKLAIKVTSYIVFIILGLLFGLTGSLRPVLDKFIDGRINAIELTLNRNFPNTRIMDININTKEFVEISNQLQQSVKDIDTSSDSFFEKMVYDAFTAKLTPYINAIDSSTNTLAMMGNEQREITIKTILLNLKKMALDSVSPYFHILKALIVILSIIAICVYIGIIIFLKKGGALYNKSIVYGDNQ